MAKKVATTKETPKEQPKEQPTQSVAVRDILSTTDLTAPKDVVEAVREKFGLTVPATYVSVIKTKLNKGTTTPRKATDKRAENGRASASIVAFVRFARQLGKEEAIDLINELF